MTEPKDIVIRAILAVRGKVIVEYFLESDDRRNIYTAELDDPPGGALNLALDQLLTKEVAAQENEPIIKVPFEDRIADDRGGHFRHKGQEDNDLVRFGYELSTW